MALFALYFLDDFVAECFDLLVRHRRENALPCGRRRVVVAFTQQGAGAGIDELDIRIDEGIAGEGAEAVTGAGADIAIILDLDGDDRAILTSRAWFTFLFAVAGTNAACRCLHAVLPGCLQFFPVAASGVLFIAAQVEGDVFGGCGGCFDRGCAG